MSQIILAIRGLQGKFFNEPVEIAEHPVFPYSALRPNKSRVKKSFGANRLSPCRRWKAVNRSLAAGNPSGARLLRGDHDRFAVHCHGGFEPASLGQKASVKWLNTMGVEPLAASLARKQ